MVCIVAVECFRIRRVRTEPIMYVGKRQPRFREGKGLFFKVRRFVGYARRRVDRTRAKICAAEQQLSWARCRLLARSVSAGSSRLRPVSNEHRTHIGHSLGSSPRPQIVECPLQDFLLEFRRQGILEC
jgi:hypothetical protein